MKFHPTSRDMEECMKLLEWKGQSVPLLPPPPVAVAEVTMITQDIFRRIKELKSQGWGTRRIARKLDLDRNTIKAYLGQEEFVPYSRQGGKHPSLGELEEWLRARTPEVGFNAKVLFREAQMKGYLGGYETIKRFVRPLREAMEKAAEASVRFETDPGQQGQVDWGSAKVFFLTGPIRVHFFVMVLGFSRRLFARGYEDERRKHLIDGHLRAFEWFGGYPRELLYDNARTMVMTERPEEGRLNKVFKDFADHYGFEPRFCAPYRPRTKGKVESGVKYLKRNFLAGRVFRDLAHLNAELEIWLTEVADKRIHGTTHVAPAVRFEEERQALHPIRGARPWQPETALSRKVANDGHVDVRTNRYPVPLEMVGQTVKIQVEEEMVIIRNTGGEIARHAALRGRFQHAPCPAEFKKAPTSGRVPADQAPKHDPRWSGIDVEKRDLSVYDRVAGQEAA